MTNRRHRRSSSTAGGYFYAVIDTSGKVTDSSYGFDTQHARSATTIDEALTDGNAIADGPGTDGQTQRVYVLGLATTATSDRLLQIGRSIKPEQDDLDPAARHPDHRRRRQHDSDGRRRDT